ncbi:hypothetical protein MFIFM68171_00174 [Madurella fahalii]|uniref:Fungal N-terminal domain-containing protein n=1 Tax=Madurella fahalii TaxID=1157608 RepID=A0ABQ0FWS9_9PEZI
MEVALTFGSIGDIITICQLAVQLRRVLGRGCNAIGSSEKEYQALREDLGLFVQILSQVVATYQEREYSVYLSSLDNATKAVVDDCAGLIEAALQHFGSRYQDNLRAGGSGNKWKDAYKKVEWSVKEKERLQELQEKLRQNTERLALLSVLAMRKSARVDNATMLARIDEVQRLVSAEATCRKEIIRLLKEQRNTVKRQADELGGIHDELVSQSGGILEALASAKQSFTAVVEVKKTLAEVAKAVISIQALASASTCLRFIDPTKDLPVIIEDALGGLFTIPAEWVDCLEWDTLYSLLRNWFRGRKGYEMVCRYGYFLEEEVSGECLDWELPLEISLRRGMRVCMSMAFAVNSPSPTCPQCHTKRNAPEGLMIQW